MKVSQSIRAIIAILCIAAVLGVFLPSPTINASPVKQSFSASLEPLAGLVQFMAAGQSDWQTVTKVTLLNKGDQVRTANDGAARITTVTGIKVEVYPTTLVELQSLSLGDGDKGKLTFIMSQDVGTTYVTLDQPLKAGDDVQVITPSVTANVRGTKFYVFVSHHGHTAIVGEENTVDVINFNRLRLRNRPEDITFAIFLFKKEVAACTVDLLAGSRSVQFLPLPPAQRLEILKQFLMEFLTSNVNNKFAAFLFRFLDLPESTTIDELIKAINATKKPFDFAQFIQDFRSFMRAYFVFISTATLAPATCGNGVKDDGETEANCATDLMDIKPTRGDGLCQTEKGESLLNDPEDCLPFGKLSRSCIELLNKLLNGEIIIIPGGNKKTPIAVVTKTPVPNPTNPPKPSGG